jgi:tripartite-type tricarboxylate transporter receptor subunit TctC
MSVQRMILITLTLACALQASAQGVTHYPNRPVRLIVSSSPGGGQDIVGRAFAARLGEQLGQSFVVDNRGGGGGSVAAEIARAAAPDGYTMILMSGSAVIYPLLYPASYDLLNDYVALTQITQQPYVLVVHPSVPAKTFHEFIAHAKANPGKLNYASAGQGGLIHLGNELLNLATGIKTVHIPYKGTGAAYPDLIAGNVQMTLANITSSAPHVRNGRLRALAVSSAKRAQIAPDLPTIAESGVKGYDVTQWYGMFLPARTPKPIADKLSGETIKTAQHPDTARRLAADGTETLGTRPAEFNAHLKTEIARWSKVLKETGIKGG